MTSYPLIFLAGLAGSVHCIGMCGGFACALGADSRGGIATLLRHLSYNGGRLTSYIFLGALAGAAGGLCLAAGGESSAVLAQRALALVSGVLMIFVGLQFFGLLPGRHGSALGVGGQVVVQAFRTLVRAPGPGAPLALGVFNGFLPCPLVYAFAAQAASTAAPLPGALTMAAFGLGTFPALLLTAGLGRWLEPVWRHRGVHLAGAFIFVFGVITLARGLVPLDSHGLHL